MRTSINCIFVLIAFSGLSQNLVLNPSFEENTPCPHSYQKGSMTKVLDHWISPDEGTPDIYHTCSNGDAGIPKNWAGRLASLDGDVYLGIYLWKFLQYRENLLTRLSEPLIADSTYQFGCYVGHASYSEFKSKTIEFGFSNDSITFDKNFKTHNQISSNRLGINEPIKRGWSLLKGTYKAKGGESFLAIGSIKEFLVDTVKWKYYNIFQDEPQLNQASYYFLDSVFVSSAYPKARKEIVFSLDQIHFKFNKTELTEAAISQLDSLLESVIPIIENVIIEGHTDDVGSGEYNLTLSLQRAETVRSYLSGHLLNVKINSIPFGETSPKVPNSNELNRAINRRVVIRIFYLE